MGRGGVNPIFYGFVLLFIVGLHVFHITIIQPESPYAFYFFSIHAFLQAILEFLIIYGVALVLKERFHRSVYFIFVSLVFTLLMAHVTDFILVRIMGLTFFNALDLVLGETLDNFIEMLQLTGIPLAYWGFFLLLAVVLLPAAALTTYTISSKFSNKSFEEITIRRIAKAVFVMPLLLLVVDVAFLPSITKKEYIRFTTALPFKTTIIPFPSEGVALSGHLRRPDNQVAFTMEKKSDLPNVYIWVVESLREDYVTEKTAPRVVQFREENISLPYTVSGANATQGSWYTIFHGNSAIHWAETRERSRDGAIPLQLLKQMGYDIHLYSAAQLKYYNVDELLFGENTKLLTSKNVFPHYPPKEAYESDLQAYGAMMSDITREGNEHGKVFLLFLDSTHFEYSWPPEYPAPFAIDEMSSHVQVSNGEAKLDHLKQRYKNSIHFVDSLFGSFKDTLQTKGMYDQACIVFTGDHGEEFYEEGRLYHASHLSSMQTTPPIYYKLGTDNDLVKSKATIAISSHMDIMPTLLDYISKQEIDISFCEGYSLLREYDKRLGIVARYNGNRTPFEFYLHDGSLKCLLQFDKKKSVYDSKGLHIIHFFDRNEEEIEIKGASEHLKAHFQQFLQEKFVP